MTVLGVGLDLVEVDAFAEQLDAPGTTFEESFSARELADTSGEPPERRARRLAARFAVKEAFIKAWSVARPHRAPALSEVNLAEIEVVLDVAGRPILEVRGEVADAVRCTLGEVAMMTSLTHEHGTAAAVVLIQAP
ncbi:MAG: holo-ACP synthase [Microthrixaceae bacterium]